jgi:hypothetical protein
LQAELAALNGLSIDSAKLLSEKLSLVRELATIKPELECLRTQVTYQQTVLADKLALQRQVNTLEVELETQKRASKRAVYKDTDGEKEDFRREMDELRKEVSREKRERERTQKTLEERSKEWETSKSMLESKIEQLRTKLREAKDKLKESRTELAQTDVAATKLVTASLAGEPASITSRKRGANKMSSDAAIGTPDGVVGRGKQSVAKKGKLDQTIPGEKSMFSITPFLNRSIPEIQQNTNLSRVGEQEVERTGRPASGRQKLCEVGRGLVYVQAPAALPAAQKQKDITIAENGVLKLTEEMAINAKAPKRKSQKIGALEKVIEENDNENFEWDLQTISVKNTESSLQTHAIASEDLEPKKKRRKFNGARTLFEDEDSEAAKRPVKIMSGPVRLLEGGTFVKVKNGIRGRVGPSLGDIGAFSPLKRDKRGTQASFLV